MKVTIDNRDLEDVHIDTYTMLNGESAEGREREYMREEGREDWDTVDIEYDHEAIVDKFAHASIEKVWQEVRFEKPQVIESITFVSCGSPKYYNYTTDYYIADYEVNTPKLQEYIVEHYDAVREKAKTYDDSIVEGDVSTENLAHAGLCHYIDSIISKDDYNMAMWEAESDVYYQNMKIVE